MIVAIYLSGAGLFFALAWVLAKRRLAKHFVNPLVLFCSIYGVGYFLFPAWALASQRHILQASYSETTVVIAWFGFMLFGMATVLTFTALRGQAYYECCRASLYNVAYWPKVRASGVVVFGVLLLGPSLLAMLWVWTRIGSYGYSEYIADRIVLSSGYGYITQVLQWTLLFLIYFYVYHSARRRKGLYRLRQLLIPALVLLSSAAGAFRGSRSSILLPFLFLFVIHILLTERGRLSSRRIMKVVGIVSCLLLIGILLGPVRQQVARGDQVRLEMVELASATRGLIATYGGYERVWWLMENTSARDWLGGRTFLAAAVGFVPRRVWPNKPVGGGPHFRNLVHPGSYDLQQGRYLTSYTTGLPTEAYMNFGYFGLVGVGIGYGLILWAVTVFGSLVKGPAGFTLWFMSSYIVLLMVFGEFFGSMSKVFSAVLAVGLASAIHHFIGGGTTLQRSPGSRSLQPVYWLTGTR